MESLGVNTNVLYLSGLFFFWFCFFCFFNIGIICPIDIIVHVVDIAY